MSQLPLFLLALPIPVLMSLTLILLLLFVPLPLPLLMFTLHSATEEAVVLVFANLHAHLASLRHLSIALAILATVPIPTIRARSTAWTITRLLGFVLLLSFAVIPTSSAKNLSPCIHGTVIDPDGATIKGARVLVTNQKTELVYKTQTGADGTYEFSKLPSGIYSLSVQVPGFQTLTVYGINLSADSDYSKQIQMFRGRMTSFTLLPAAGDQAKDKPDVLAVRTRSHSIFRRDVLRSVDVQAGGRHLSFAPSPRQHP
jgi:hypothetical protein